jgi:hypothetical protein
MSCSSNSTSAPSSSGPNVSVSLIFAECVASRCEQNGRPGMEKRWSGGTHTCFWQLAVRLEIPGLVARVFLDHVGFVVLEFTQGQEDDVALVDPDL